jgi:hypothetical protein
LYIPHSRALAALYADVEGYGLTVASPFLGTAGSVVERKNAGGFVFYSHQFYDGEGKKTERYIAGPVGRPAADAAAEALRDKIIQTKEIVPSLRLLGREGFYLVDAKTFATLASLTKHGVFDAGGVLIGSHAFGVIMNRLGVKALGHATEDIDIARKEALAFREAPQEGFLSMLKESGIEFVEVPGLDPRIPATSFKQRGKARFHVDLLVPSKTEDFPVVAVPELRAHATGLPYLDYLLEESQLAMLMAREGCCPVRVPLPERFAIHKLLVSRLRVGRDAKANKDVRQACILAAALGDQHPGALESARKAVPRKAERILRLGIAVAKKHLEGAHPRAWDEITASKTPRN